MKQYMALYLGNAEAREAWMAMNEAERKEREKEILKAWASWYEKHEDVIADGGAPLGKTKRIDTSGVSDTKNEIGGYTIVNAESHDEAAQLFVDHPHCSFAAGNTIEVMECLPMPEMPEA